ncbi:hypothetical protein O181_003288 [Austropuccinia psidii MF-1]|uniref:Uncharacterized protein n=1 Tax=Austropuccinia psidii MF-1 TaxID=1389203 RepID=A0A9Q3BEE9_9BASI|nr:hypothetical protein [Austropuccinia psidii MF-1]
MKGVTPDGSNLMRTIVQIHCCEILKMVSRDITTLPDPPTDAEKQLALIYGKSIAFNPDQSTATASQNIQSKAFQSYFNTQVQSLGLTHFTFDWCSGWKHPNNKLMATLFYHTFDMTLRSGE